jgi:hypothetical protein
MQPPQIIQNDLPNLDNTTLSDLAEVVAALGEHSESEEEHLTWLAILHALEIERYSRGL